MPVRAWPIRSVPVQGDRQGHLLDREGIHDADALERFGDRGKHSELAERAQGDSPHVVGRALFGAQVRYRSGTTQNPIQTVRARNSLHAVYRPGRSAPANAVARLRSAP